MSVPMPMGITHPSKAPKPENFGCSKSSCPITPKSRRSRTSDMYPRKAMTTRRCLPNQETKLFISSSKSSLD
ncbi:hypothetical protein CPB83DRAFT_858262 [Crepidotus variabilis]|uniref:Uncharacterized protein n=1 Tax=Crepidotus variabilis TaxID=179855 RepID=A0A9P6EC17_9AGAR|nr:hypothetical protein CPB83DRAFT_858262 [Crepidotus variabilis]